MVGGYYRLGCLGECVATVTYWHRREEERMERLCWLKEVIEEGYGNTNYGRWESVGGGRGQHGCNKVLVIVSREHVRMRLCDQFSGGADCTGFVNYIPGNFVLQHWNFSKVFLQQVTSRRRTRRSQWSRCHPATITIIIDRPTVMPNVSIDLP